MSSINWRRIAYGVLVGMIGIGFGLLIGLLSKTTSYSPIALNELSEVQRQKAYLRDLVDWDWKKYRQLYDVVHYESSWRDWVYGDNGLAYSLAQFHEPTFEAFKVKADKAFFEYSNPYHQLELLVYAYNNKKMYHWTTWKLVN